MSDDRIEIATMEMCSREECELNENSIDEVQMAVTKWLLSTFKLDEIQPIIILDKLGQFW